MSLLEHCGGEVVRGAAGQTRRVFQGQPGETCQQTGLSSAHQSTHRELRKRERRNQTSGRERQNDSRAAIFVSTLPDTVPHSCGSSRQCSAASVQLSSPKNLLRYRRVYCCC